MRSDRVFTNLVCNQGCTFCNSRSASDDRAFVRPEAVRQRISDAITAGAKEIVLTGGEPALRWDLASLVAHARASGAERVHLETNGTEIDPARAKALAEAGLTLARVNAVGLVSNDAVTRDPGGADRTIAGIHALLEVGIEVHLDAAIVASTRAGLLELPARMRTLFDSVQTLILRVPVESPDPSELISYDDAAVTMAALDRQARRAGVTLKLAPDSGPPPCVFQHPVQVAHLYSLTPGASQRSDHVHVEACRECQVADRCSGLPRAYLDRRPPPAMHPIEEDRLRRRLALVDSVEAQMQREFVSDSRFHSEQGAIDEKIIRVNFQCNQSCRFCFVSTHLPGIADAQIRETIVRAARAGQRVTLSGGEPTLNPHVVEYVRLARDNGCWNTCLQTNATRLADRTLVQALVDAGLYEVFVSLHGSTAEISDAITEAPGTFVQTVAGIDELAKTSMPLVLNFVICQKNYRDLVPYVRFVAARWPKALINISFVAPSSDVVPNEKALIPRYSDVLPGLAAALAEAGRLGVKVVGFESMCGLPLCLVPAGLDEFFSLSDVPEGYDGGEFVKPPVCRTCALESKCYGLRRGYRELHGDGELKAVPTAAPA